MPLLNDAKACYVGNTRIDRIMAGSVQVWPKGPPPPFRDVELYIGNPLGDSGTASATGFYLMWEAGVRPVDCDAADMYEYRLRKSNRCIQIIWKPWYRLVTGNVFVGFLGLQNLKIGCLHYGSNVHKKANSFRTIAIHKRHRRYNIREIVFPIGPSDLSSYELCQNCTGLLSRIRTMLKGATNGRKSSPNIYSRREPRNISVTVAGEMTDVLSKSYR